MTIKYTLHPFYPDEKLAPLLSICGDDGYNYIIEEDTVPVLIDLLSRYQNGKHDGIIEYNDPRTSPVWDGWMTTAEVAETFGVSQDMVRVSIHRGYIEAKKSGRTWLIPSHKARARWGK